MTTQTQTNDDGIDFDTLLADLLDTAADAIEETGHDSTNAMSDDRSRQAERGFSAAMDELRKIPYSEVPGNKEIVQAVDEAVNKAVRGDGSVDDLRRDDDDEGAELDREAEDLLAEVEADDDEDTAADDADVDVGDGEHYCGALGRVVGLEVSRCPQCVAVEGDRTRGEQ